MLYPSFRKQPACSSPSIYIRYNNKVFYLLVWNDSSSAIELFAKLVTKYQGKTVYLFSLTLLNMTDDSEVHNFFINSFLSSYYLFYYLWRKPPGWAIQRIFFYFLIIWCFLKTEVEKFARAHSRNYFTLTESQLTVLWSSPPI